MESFAFWYKEKSNAPKLSAVYAVMNFNLWCACGWGRKSGALCENNPFLDIGFKLEHLSCAEELYFFLPVKISEEDKVNCIEDLGCKFQKTSLVDATFNETYRTTISANSKTIDVVRQQDREDAFKIYQLDIEHDIRLERFDNGTILSIGTDRIIYGEENAAAVYYFRFRIKGLALDFLIHQYLPPNYVLQSLFRTTYMVDFRYHNIRSLQPSLIEKFGEGSNKVIKVKALHFLLMTKAYVDVSSNAFRSVRKIEHQVWKEYVNQHDTTDLVAYHFADKPQVEYNRDRGSDVDEENVATKSEQEQAFINSSELFAKFSVERTVIPLYLIITLLLGILGSIFGTIIWEYLLKRLPLFQQSGLNIPLLFALFD